MNIKVTKEQYKKLVTEVINESTSQKWDDGKLYIFKCGEPNTYEAIRNSTVFGFIWSGTIKRTFPFQTISNQYQPCGRMLIGTEVYKPMVIWVQRHFKKYFDSKK